MNLETNSCTLFGWCWWFFCCHLRLCLPLSFGLWSSWGCCCWSFRIRNINQCLDGRSVPNRTSSGCSGRTNLPTTTHQLRQSLSRWSNCCFSCCWNFCCLLLRTAAPTSTPKAYTLWVIGTITVRHRRRFGYYGFYFQPKLKVPETHHQLIRKNKTSFRVFMFSFWVVEGKIHKIGNWLYEFENQDSDWIPSRASAG